MKRRRYQYGSLELKRRRNGEPVWVYRYVEPRPGGGSIRRSVQVGTRSQYPTEAAARKACGGLVLVANPDRPSMTTITVDDLVGRFVKEELSERYSTRSAYSSYLRRWVGPKWASYTLSEVKSLAVEQWLKSLPLAPKSRRHIRTLMRLLFQCAVRWELMAANPIDLVRVKGGTKRLTTPRVLSPEEFCRVLAHLAEPHRTMVLIAGCLGLRVSEIVALKWGDFDWEKLAVKVERGAVNGRVGDTKTEYSQRGLPLDPDLATEILRWKGASSYPFQGPDDFVFPNYRTGGVRSQDSIRQDYLIPAGVKAEVGRIGWHTFRHSYRAWMKRSEAPIEVQQELMRHANIQTTLDTYGEEMVVTEQHREANSKVVRLVLRKGREEQNARVN